jgi:hypothetical protein
MVDPRQSPSIDRAKIPDGIETKAMKKAFTKLHGKTSLDRPYS